MVDSSLRLGYYSVIVCCSGGAVARVDDGSDSVRGSVNSAVFCWGREIAKFYSATRFHETAGAPSRAPTRIYVRSRDRSRGRSRFRHVGRQPVSASFCCACYKSCLVAVNSTWRGIQNGQISPQMTRVICASADGERPARLALLIPRQDLSRLAKIVHTVGCAISRSLQAGFFFPRYSHSREIRAMSRERWCAMRCAR